MMALSCRKMLKWWLWIWKTQFCMLITLTDWFCWSEKWDSCQSWDWDQRYRHKFYKALRWAKSITSKHWFWKRSQPFTTTWARKSSTAKRVCFYKSWKTLNPASSPSTTNALKRTKSLGTSLRMWIDTLKCSTRPQQGSFRRTVDCSNFIWISWISL